jgi:hypothetical protein
MLNGRCTLAAAVAATWFAGASLAVDELPPNTWVTVDDAPGGGCAAGLVSVPDQKGVLLFGRRDGKGADRYWAELFTPSDHKWTEWIPAAGRLSAQNNRSSCYTQWTTKDGYGMPLLPYYNVGFWGAHQMCLLPDEKKVLYFWGGVTFTYDPAARTFANLNIPFGKAPPDVQLGSMAWDPVGREAILFGGGEPKAYQARPGDVKQDRPADAWTPEQWDRRGTWAYSPTSNTWRKLETASREVVDAQARLLGPSQELRTLWGATRGVAFEYGDLATGRKPAEIGQAVEKLAATLAAVAREIAGKGATDYEKWQFATAAALLEKDVAARLQDAAGALKSADGWQALRALDTADAKLAEAREALAVAPRPRHYARLVTDPVNKVMVLWGGDGEDRFLADTWLLHLDTRRWERCRVAVHPSDVDSAMVAMDYDAKNKVIVLAHQKAGLWTFDAARREWRKLEVAGEFGRKGKGSTWLSLEYVPAADLHVLIDSPAATLTPDCPPRRTQLLRLDLASAKVADAPAGKPEEAWRPQYGQGCGGPADKYGLAWSFLPKTQAEYREKVAAHRKVLEAVAPNAWTELKAPYSGFGRAYGSFCYDWDRDEILLWGGGHSAYMGNEWSQYDLKANLWMESWNPEFPPHPHGSPDGPGWTPHFTHTVGSGHGYHNYVYSGVLKKAVLWGAEIYDPDRMRYAPKGLQVIIEGSRQSSGLRVEMNGAPETFSVSCQHWYGGPFGVWRLDPAAGTTARIKGSDTPFGTNDRAKAVYDTKRKRILFYGATNSKEKGGKCNALWAYAPAENKWEKLEPAVEPAGASAPPVEAWNYCYAEKYDGLLIPAKSATWFYDCGKNTLRQIPCPPRETAAGVIYSPRQDLFYMLDGDGYRPQKVFVLRLNL